MSIRQQYEGHLRQQVAGEENEQMNPKPNRNGSRCVTVTVQPDGTVVIVIPK